MKNETQSDDPKYNKTWLAAANNADDWKKKDNTPNTPSTTEVSVPIQDVNSFTTIR